MRKEILGPNKDKNKRSKRKNVWYKSILANTTRITKEMPPVEKIL